MVMLENQIIFFFEAATQMVLIHNTRIFLQVEVITVVGDLAEFTNVKIKQVAENLRRPYGLVVAPNTGVGSVPKKLPIPTPLYTFGTKSQLRLKAGGDIVRYYETINRVVTPNMVRWQPEAKNCTQHWKVLCTRSTSNKHPVLKIIKEMPLVKWLPKQVCGKAIYPPFLYCKGNSGGNSSTIYHFTQPPLFNGTWLC